jgi:hypothetical protein
MPDAESAVPLDEQVATLRDECAKEWARLDTRLRITEGGGNVNDAHVKEVYRDFVAHRDMSLWRRLRWLVWGSRYA